MDILHMERYCRIDDDKNMSYEDNLSAEGITCMYTAPMIMVLKNKCYLGCRHNDDPGNGKLVDDRMYAIIILLEVPIYTSLWIYEVYHIPLKFQPIKIHSILA